MTPLIPLGFFLALLAVITLLGHRAYVRPARRYQRIIRRSAVDEALLCEEDKPAGEVLLGWLQRIGRRLPVSPAHAAGTRRELVAAGYRSEGALHIYFGLRLVLCAGLLLATLAACNQLGDNPALRIALVWIGIIAGYLLPRSVLQRRVQRRQERLRHALPDAQDLLVVALEAGMALDQAIQTVCRELAIAHRDLSDEMSLVHLEIRAGKHRADALHHMVERTGEPEIRKLIAILIQSDRFGTGVGEALRKDADLLRERRRQQAQERAGKIGIKLVFATFFFIMPSMVLVTAGPGLLNICKKLFPMMGNL